MRVTGLNLRLKFYCWQSFPATKVPKGNKDFFLTLGPASNDFCFDLFLFLFCFVFFAFAL